MTIDNPQRSVLVIGKSQRVLDEAIAGLRDLGYNGQATNDFSDIAPRFDVQKVDLVVFGGQVPPDRKAELREEIGAINPQIIFVQGLAGIPGLIINQIQGAFAAQHQDPARAPIYRVGDHSIRLNLAEPADVKITLWWGTSFVPPDPKSDSLVLLDDELAEGEQAIPVPDHIPRKAAFATVKINEAIYAFSIGTEQ